MKERQQLQDENDYLEKKIVEFQRESEHSYNKLSFLSSFKDCFDKHHPLTSVLLCLAVVVFALVGLMVSIAAPDIAAPDHVEYVYTALYMFAMSFVNYQIFKFNKWIWIVAVVLCSPNAVLFALLFLLKKNGKNSYYYLKNNT